MAGDGIDTQRSEWAAEMDRRLERMRTDPEAYVEDARRLARSHDRAPRVAFYLLATLAVIGATAALAMFYAAIWTGDIRWAFTAFTTTFATIPLGGLAAQMWPDE